jgi:alkylhydroperoxidase family enzyme
MSAMSHFLRPAAPSPQADELFADDVADFGFVFDASRMWAHQPWVHQELFGLLGRVSDAAGLTLRTRGVLVLAVASALGDAYCSYAWGVTLTAEAGEALPVGVLTCDDSALTPAERVLARWARHVVRDPNGTTAQDVQELRDAGLDDAAILAVTTFVALRLAFSTINDALGAVPDRELVELAGDPVRAAVTWGRRP